jgi:hypothetical protein
MMVIFTLQVTMSLEAEHISFLKSKIYDLLTFKNKLNLVKI